jgi:hypothetical protein
VTPSYLPGCIIIDRSLEALAIVVFLSCYTSGAFSKRVGIRCTIHNPVGGLLLVKQSLAVLISDVLSTREYINGSINQSINQSINYTCIHKQGTMVYPVVGYIHERNFESLDDVRAMVHDGTEDGGEVDEVFAASLSQLTHPENVQYENLGGRYRHSPRFQVDDFPVIWGLTAFILHGFLKDVIAPITIDGSETATETSPSSLSSLLKQSASGESTPGSRDSSPSSRDPN